MPTLESLAATQHELEEALRDDGKRFSAQVVDDIRLIVTLVSLGGFILGVSSACGVKRWGACCCRGWRDFSWFLTTRLHYAAFTFVILVILGGLAAGVGLVLAETQDTIGGVNGELLNGAVEQIGAELLRNAHILEANTASLFDGGVECTMNLTNPTSTPLVLSSLNVHVVISSSEVARVTLLSEALLAARSHGTILVLVRAFASGGFSSVFAYQMGGLMEVNVQLDSTGDFVAKTFDLRAHMQLPLMTEHLPAVPMSLGGVDLEPWMAQLARWNGEAVKRSIIVGLDYYKARDMTMLQWDELELSGSVLDQPTAVVVSLTFCVVVFAWIIGELCGRGCFNYFDQRLDKEGDVYLPDYARAPPPVQAYGTGAPQYGGMASGFPHKSPYGGRPGPYDHPQVIFPQPAGSWQASMQHQALYMGTAQPVGWARAKE